MKKIFLFSALVAVTTLSLVASSCKKSSNSPAIVGNWEESSNHSVATYATTPPTTYTVDTNYTHGKSEIISIKSDNTYVVTDYSTSPSTVSDQGTYTTSSTQLFIHSTTTSKLDTASYVISGSKMVLTENVTAAPGVSVVSAATFTRQ